MKRCLKCGREYDSTMAFCLDDGAELLYGPASSEIPVGGPDEQIKEEIVDLRSLTRIIFTLRIPSELRRIEIDLAEAAG